MGITPVSVDAPRARAAALEHMLGVVSFPPGSDTRRIAPAFRPVLRAVIALQRAAESAVARATALCAAQCLRLQRQDRALVRLRGWTWANPKPSGGLCMCCPGRVHRA